MIWTKGFSGKGLVKARFWYSFSSDADFRSLKGKKKQKPNKQTTKKQQKNFLPLGWEALAPHHLVAALKSQPRIPVVARRPLGHAVWF